MTTETDKIEQDIYRSRHALNDTMEKLGGKLSPGRMVDEAMGLAQGQADAFAATLGRQVRDNPIPMLLIGAGIAMLTLHGHKAEEISKVKPSDDDWHAEHHFRKLESVRAQTPRNEGESDEAYDRRMHDAHATALDIKQMAGEAYDGFQARVSRTVEGLERRANMVRESVSDGMSKASTFVSDQARHVGEMTHDARGQVADLYSQNPLAAGAIGVAIGALIGALTPLSSMERDKLQGVADKALHAGADLAEHGASAVEKATGNIVH